MSDTRPHEDGDGVEVLDAGGPPRRWSSRAPVVVGAALALLGGAWAVGQRDVAPDAPGAVAVTGAASPSPSPSGLGYLVVAGAPRSWTGTTPRSASVAIPVRNTSKAAVVVEHVVVMTPPAPDFGMDSVAATMVRPAAAAAAERARTPPGGSEVYGDTVPARLVVPAGGTAVLVVWATPPSCPADGPRWTADVAVDFSTVHGTVVQTFSTVPVGPGSAPWPWVLAARACAAASP